MKKQNYKESIAIAMHDILEGNENAVVLGQGVTDPTRIFGTTVGLLEKFGKERVIEMPIMEEGMTGIAIGMALNGLYPVQTHIRVDFLLLAMNQLVNMAAKYRYMYGGAFEAAQQRTPQFQQLYPQTMQAPFSLMGQVADVGAERRALAQEAINRDIQRYTYEQQAPQAALQNYMASISGDYGSTVTAPGPSGIQSLGQILGVAAPLLGLT